MPEATMPEHGPGEEVRQLGATRPTKEPTTCKRSSREGGGPRGAAAPEPHRPAANRSSHGSVRRQRTARWRACDHRGCAMSWRAVRQVLERSAAKGNARMVLVTLAERLN